MIESVSIEPHPTDPPIHDDGSDYSNTIFVIFDTVMFSSSVVTLLDSFVDCVRPIESISHLQEYEDDPNWIIGEEGTYVASDFNNSVHHIKSVLGYEPPTENQAVLLSSNGALASHQIAREMDPEPEAVIIGAPSNIESINQFLTQEYDNCEEIYDIVLYGAGHRGHPVFEDMFVSWVLYTHLEMEEAQLEYQFAEEILKLYMQRVTWSDASWFHQEDIELVSQWNTTDTIPIYDSELDAFIRQEDYIQ